MTTFWSCDKGAAGWPRLFLEDVKNLSTAQTADLAARFSGNCGSLPLLT